jgi:hypothetical protein
MGSSDAGEMSETELADLILLGVDVEFGELRTALIVLVRGA